jgi:hypothetical protein
MKLPPIPPLNLSCSGDTTEALSDTIHLNNTGTYGCGISQIHGKIVPTIRTEGDLYLCCDIIAPCYVGQNKIPCLTLIKKKEKTGFVSIVYPKIIWHEVIRNTIPSVRLYITDKSGHLVSLKSCDLNCQLLVLPF